jgi:hypothetical protein
MIFPLANRLEVCYTAITLEGYPHRFRNNIKAIYIIIEAVVCQGKTCTYSGFFIFLAAIKIFQKPFFFQIGRFFAQKITWNRRPSIPIKFVEYSIHILLKSSIDLPFGNWYDSVCQIC